MNTENLNEMVTSNHTQPSSGLSSEYEFLLHHTKREEEFSNLSQKDSSLGQELQIVEKTESDAEVQQHYQPEPIASEASTAMTTIIPETELVSEYHPESEQALIDYVNRQNNKLEMANILVKWEIGRCINSFY